MGDVAGAGVLVGSATGVEGSADGEGCGDDDGVVEAVGESEVALGVGVGPAPSAAAPPGTATTVAAITASPPRRASRTLMDPSCSTGSTLLGPLPVFLCTQLSPVPP